MSSFHLQDLVATKVYDELSPLSQIDDVLFSRVIDLERSFLEHKQGFREDLCRSVVNSVVEELHRAIIDHQLPFEYTITSRSTDVMVLVLRVKKLFVIEQPLPTAPAADSEAQVLAQWNAVYDAYNEEEGKSVSSYVLKMKGYVEKLERLGYVLPQDISVRLILNVLTSGFAGFVATPQVMAIQGCRIQKANKKLLNAKGKGKGKDKGKDKPVYIPKPKNHKPSTKEHQAKDEACHHCKEVGHWKRNYPIYLAELIKKKKQVGTASSSCIFTI
ncbi:retrotransposon protein, putative, ty1-copia subclass [Tanacetum coccineum]|uniref:Retrotransposon protein, putative, ty1-copia subclass n=1 Tax=Tanacetum coccineum TaxID=301880 RepID=A0ABQ5ARM8_9ASTR